MEFRPFSLADSINSASNAAFNTYRLRDMQNQMAEQQAYRDTAQMAAKGVPTQGTPALLDPNTRAPQTDPNALASVNSALTQTPESPAAQQIANMFNTEMAPHNKGYNPDYHAKLLEERGFPEKAMALRKAAREDRAGAMGAKLQAYDFISRAAPLVQDQQSYDVLRQNLEQTGLAKPGELPAQFGPDTQGMLRTLGINAKQQADLTWKSREFGLSEARLEETQRHNRAMENKKGGLAVTLPDGTVISTGGPGLGKPAVNKIEEKQLDSIEALSRLNNMQSNFKPEFLTYDAKWSNMVTGVKEKAGFKLQPSERKFVTEFSRFKQDALSNTNRTIKEITGAAMTEGEAKRIQGELPNVGNGLFDGDSPTQFKSKLDNGVRNVKRALVRYNYAKRLGKDPLKTGIELADVDNLVRERGKELEATYRQRNPQADPSTIQLMVRDQMAREFGLE